jgi:hypothetical protein
VLAAALEANTGLARLAAELREENAVLRAENAGGSAADGGRPVVGEDAPAGSAGR